MKDIDTSNFDKNVNSINYKYNMHVSFKDYTIEPIYKLKDLMESIIMIYVINI